MDRTEVTVAAYGACVRAGGCSPAPTAMILTVMSPESVGNWSQLCNARLPNVDNHPINCVDWAQADAYCRWQGGRLPTEAEWEYAARGRDGRVYPWGNGAPGHTLLNGAGSESRALVLRLSRTASQTGWNVLYPGDDGWASTAPVGSFPAGASPFGLLDMAGNVNEWTADWFVGRDPSEAIDAPGDAGAQRRVIRGGSWISNDPSKVRVTHRNRDLPTHRDVRVGFRCARDAR